MREGLCRALGNEPGVEVRDVAPLDKEDCSVFKEVDTPSGDRCRLRGLVGFRKLSVTIGPDIMFEDNVGEDTAGRDVGEASALVGISGLAGTVVDSAM